LEALAFKDQIMPTYNVDKQFWYKGLLQEVDTAIDMTVAEAKYLGHVVSKAVVAVVSAVSAPQKQVSAPPAPQALGVAVAEDDADGAAGN
jgi:hypothetical protein